MNRNLEGIHTSDNSQQKLTYWLYTACLTHLHSSHRSLAHPYLMTANFFTNKLPLLQNKKRKVQWNQLINVWMVQYRLRVYVEASEFVLDHPHMWGEGIMQQLSNWVTRANILLLGLWVTKTKIYPHPPPKIQISPNINIQAWDGTLEQVKISKMKTYGRDHKLNKQKKNFSNHRYYLQRTMLCSFSDFKIFYLMKLDSKQKNNNFSYM